MRVEAKQIQELRNLSGAGVMDCKRVLEVASGDLTKALALLQEMADKLAVKKAEKETKAGAVQSYIHGEGRIGVLIEVNCETDFLAKSTDFRTLVKELALQIASEEPQYVSPKDVPHEVIEEIEAQAEKNARILGKSERVIAQVKAGKVKKFLTKACLLEQKYIKEPQIPVASLVQALTAKSGENIRIARFARFQIS